MTYNQYLKKLVKSPLVLTANIIFSTLVFFQFFSLFFGRWIDLVEFGSNVLLLVTIWMMFAKASSKWEKSMSGIRTCTFIFAIVKLISLCMATVAVIVVAIYAMVNSSTYDYYFNSSSMMIGGFFLLIVGTALYVVRIIYASFFIAETNGVRRQPENYILKKNWKIGFIILACCRGLSMILQYIFSATCIRGIRVQEYGMWDYYSSSTNSGFASLIEGAIGIGGNIFVTITDLLYIAFFIIVAVVCAQYYKAVKSN